MFKVSKKIALILIALLVSITLFACGQDDENTPALAPAEEETNSGAEGTEQEEESPRTIVDQAGREVELPDEITRVVSTHNPLTFFVFAVGGQEKLVATDTPSTKNEFLNALYPEIGSLPGVGNKKGLNLEEIVKADPDVVLLRLADDTDPVLEQLETQGIPTVVVNPESVDDMKKTAEIFGEIFDTQEQAKEVIQYYENTEKLIADKLKNVTEKKRVYMTGSEVLKTVSPELYQHYLIEKAGGINVASELSGGFPTVSAEQIVEWNPDVMVALQYCEIGVDEMLSDSSQLGSVNAVKNKELYRMPSSLINWDYPEPSSSLGMLWLAKNLYPEQFADIDMVEESDNFFEKFYGKAFSEIGGVVDSAWK